MLKEVYKKLMEIAKYNKFYNIEEEKKAEEVRTQAPVDSVRPAAPGTLEQASAAPVAVAEAELKPPEPPAVP